MLPGMTPRARWIAVLALLLTLVSAQSSTATESVAPSGKLRLYTSVTQDTIDAVLEAAGESLPGLEVEVFRAPTGELEARIATELRTGGMGADVLWMTDPLSIQRYAADGLLAPLPAGLSDVVPEAYRADTFVGTRLLNLVIVAGDEVATELTSWDSLADSSLVDAVALPDPRFAGSALAALGYFATADDLGMAFYQRLRDNGAVQVSSPGEVLDGVAEGRFAAGITLDNIARAAIDKGAPVRLIWPEPGAIALYSPAAVTNASDDPVAAAAFVAFLVSPVGQAAIAQTGWQPVRADVAWPFGGPTVAPDWAALFGRQALLLEEYGAIFGD